MPVSGINNAETAVNSKNAKLMESKITQLEQNAADKYLVITEERVAD